MGNKPLEERFLTSLQEPNAIQMQREKTKKSAAASLKQAEQKEKIDSFLKLFLEQASVIQKKKAEGTEAELKNSSPINSPSIQKQEEKSGKKQSNISSGSLSQQQADELKEQRVSRQTQNLIHLMSVRSQHANSNRLFLDYLQLFWAKMLQCEFKEDIKSEIQQICKSQLDEIRGAGDIVAFTTFNQFTTNFMSVLQKLKRRGRAKKIENENIDHEQSLKKANSKILELMDEIENLQQDLSFQQQLLKSQRLKNNQKMKNYVSQISSLTESSLQWETKYKRLKFEISQTSECQRNLQTNKKASENIENKNEERNPSEQPSEPPIEQPSEQPNECTIENKQQFAVLQSQKD